MESIHHNGRRFCNVSVSGKLFMGSLESGQNRSFSDLLLGWNPFSLTDRTSVQDLYSGSLVS
ncbi:hypothetical protein RSSM_00018 [Rhodopirellula sallentina SM41]|uniref:Uncharacterized protein n=1 Tax=Rhodopirellula sallentina SM41 TaxID=1263870 RepID=M5UKV4_9BACT|nr:hypothetical protein RSSM_00018 [Rhodopirellula sallentina SM41]